MEYKLNFMIDGLPKMTNGKRRSGHWSQLHKDALVWKKMVWAKVNQMGKPRTPLTKATVEMTRHSATCPDYEGLVSGFKYVLDGLVESGVLIDDNMNVIGAPVYKWEKAKSKGGFISVTVTGVKMDAGVKTDNE